MSRSYRKTPRAKLANSKHGKNYSNRIIRRMHRDGEYTIPDGKKYRQVMCSWDICDMNCHGETWPEFKRLYEIEERHAWRAELAAHKEGRALTEKDIYKEWYRWYRMK